MISTAKFKAILGTRWPAAARIASGESETPPSGVKPLAAKKAEPQDPSELRERAEHALVHFIRHQGHIPFLDRGRQLSIGRVESFVEGSS